MKRAITVILALLLLLSVLSGCGKTEAPAKAEPAAAAPAAEAAPATEAPAEQPDKAPEQAPVEAAPEQATDVKKGGDLILSLKKSPTTFGYPPKCTGGDRNTVDPLFDRLLAIDENGEYQPALATEWEYSEDGLSLTLKLREGVKFHDGTDFNAEAAKFNLDALIPPQSTILSDISSVDIIDDYTIQINMAEYSNLILYQLASAYECYIYSPTAYTDNGEEWMYTHPVGTGPFVFDGFEPDAYVKQVKNPDYWGGEPNLDSITWQVIAESTTQLLSFEAGDIDGIFGASVRDSVTLRDAGAKINVAPGTLQALCFDTANNPALDDIRVRLAIEYAIDKEAICEGPGYGLYEPIYQVLPESSVAYSPNCEPRKYDPEKAKELLAEAGFADGLTIDCFFLESYWKDGVTSIQAYLAEVGITLNIKFGNQAAYNSIRVAGKIDPGMASQMNLYFFANPLYTQDFYWKADSGFFKFIEKPEECDALLTAAKSAKTAEERDALCRQVCELLYEDETIVPLWVNPTAVVLDEAVMEDGFFIGGDSNNINLGNNTWLNK